MSTAVSFSLGKYSPTHILVNQYFVKGWWTDANNKPITKANVGDVVRFHIATKNIPDGDEVAIEIMDWDGMMIRDDKVNIIIRGNSGKFNAIKIKDNKGYFEWKTGKSTETLIVDEGNEIELYAKCSYKLEKIELPANTAEYLLVDEKEVKITVLIELPHSKETGWGAKGLAGHSAMAIGERYFDYGPNNRPGTYSERQYDYDFNSDGDKNDTVHLATPSFKNSPGMPWWGTMVANERGITPEQVTLSQVLAFIARDWKTGTQIYGEVHKIEFYAKGSQADRMLAWWEERYKHLKVYSIWPWKGEQCTTAVKSSLQAGGFFIPDETQKPIGLLHDMKFVRSSTREHRLQLATESIIKKQSNDWTP